MDWCNKTRISFLLAAGLIAVLLFVYLSSPVNILSNNSSNTTKNKIIRLTQFEVKRSNNNTFESAVNQSAASGEIISLPDIWREHQKKRFSNAWYQTSIRAADISQPFAIYIPRVSMNVSVYINDMEIGNGGNFSEPISRNHGRPLIFFAHNFNSAPENPATDTGTLKLTLHVSDNYWALGYLGPVYVGDPATLSKTYRLREFWQVQLPIALALIMFLFSITSFVLAQWFRQESYYFWFGAAMLLFAIDTFNVYVTDIPVDRKFWEIYCQSIVLSFAITTIIFVHRFTRQGWPAIEPVFVVLFVIKTVLLVVSDVNDFYTIASIFNLFIITYGLLLTVLVVRSYLKTNSFETGITALSGIILLVFAIHTWLVQASIINPENLHTIHYGAPSFFILISFSLLRRFVRALSESEKLTNELDTRIHEKEKELAETYRKLHIINEKKTLSEERARIMREMHDGFGGQLVGALAMLESDQVNQNELSAYLKSSLLDLRVMIDSLDPNTREVSVALGMLRSRIDPILRSRHIILSWNVYDLPDELELKPNDTLNLLRVLQELITNIVKHSKGNQIKLSAAVKNTGQGQVLLIELRENGSGFRPDSATGKGLNNVHQRMLSMQGEIYFNRIDDGFETLIKIPLESPS